MAGISPLGPMPPVQMPTSTPQISAPVEASAEPKKGFGDVLKNVFDGAAQQQTQARSAVEDLLSGRTDNSLPAVMAVAKADMSFKLLIGVRNKVIEAYKQTMQMQI